jgi:ribosomal protein L12E/L44/L45/RPP1/RPP2
MKHFILGTDEACLMACATGGVKVLGDKAKKKHEKVLNDSRTSITIVRCASVSGNTGPTNFLLEGAKPKPGFTSAWLQRHGAAEGSSIVMTPSAFMTDSAWEEMSLERAKGIRAMPVIKKHPDFWVLEILDGFSSHHSSPKVLQIYYDHKILQAKEEGDTSQLCQLYDQEPAKCDKVSLRSGVDMLRQAASVTLGVVDQWALVGVGLMAVRQGTANPQMWINSAIKVNLHPDHRKPFSEWLEDKRSFLEGGKEFKIEDYSDDTYPLLSPLWHSMEPSEKRLIMAIVDRHGGIYSVKCLHDLFFEGHVPYKEIQKLRLCVDAAKENPHHLDMGMPSIRPEGNVAPELIAAFAAQAPITQGLVTFQLMPPGLTGNALFAHLVQYRMRHSPQNKPSDSLNVDMSAEQAVIIAPTMTDLMVSTIMKDAGGEGATKKLAQRKLNNVGAITNHCGLQNHPSRIKKLVAALELSASLAEISALTKANKAKDKRIADTGLMDLAPAALTKFLKKHDSVVNKLTKTEICAISFRFFGAMLKESNPKPVLVAGLEGLISAQPDVLSAAAASAAAAAAAAGTSATGAPVAQPLGAQEQESDEEDQDEYEEESAV